MNSPSFFRESLTSCRAIFRSPFKLWFSYSARASFISVCSRADLTAATSGISCLMLFRLAKLFLLSASSPLMVFSCYSLCASFPRSSKLCVRTLSSSSSTNPEIEAISFSSLMLTDSSSATLLFLNWSVSFYFSSVCLSASRLCVSSICVRRSDSACLSSCAFSRSCSSTSAFFSPSFSYSSPTKCVVLLSIPSRASLSCSCISAFSSSRCTITCSAFSTSSRIFCFSCSNLLINSPFRKRSLWTIFSYSCSWSLLICYSSSLSLVSIRFCSKYFNNSSLVAICCL